MFMHGTTPTGNAPTDSFSSDYPSFTGSSTRCMQSSAKRAFGSSARDSRLAPNGDVMKKRISRSDPTPASLREIPEVDFRRYGPGSRNPFAKRIHAEGWRVVHEN